MGALTDNTIADTYKQLLKITSEGVSADASAKYVEDGLGTDTALSLSTTRIGIGTASPTHTTVLKTDSGGSTNVLKIEEKDSTDAIVQLSFGGDYDEGSIHVYNGGTSKINLRGNGASYIKGGDLELESDGARFFVKSSTNELVSIGRAGSSGASLQQGYLRMKAVDGGSLTNKIALHTAGDSYINGGSLGIGTASPDSLIHAKVTTNTSETIRIQNDDSLTTIGVSSDGYTFHTYQHSLYWASWDGSTWSTKARMDNDGKLLIGGTTSRALSGVNSHLQVEGTTYSSSGAHLIGNTGTNASTAPILFFGRSRGTSNGSSTVVADDDRLGALFFCGADGTDINTPAATIQVSVDGTPGGNDMPGRIEFRTTADGASSTTERMRIHSDGNVSIGSSSNGDKLYITDGASAYASADRMIQLKRNATNGNNTTSFCSMMFGNNSNGFTIGYGGTTDRFRFIDGGGNEQMSIDNGGVISFQSVYGRTVGSTNRDLYIGDGGDLGYVSSVREHKMDIKSLSDASWVSDLNPVSFYRRNQNEDGTYGKTKDGSIEYGLIADEVEKVNKDFVFYDKDEDGKETLAGVEYRQLMIPMLKKIQELSAKVEELKTELQDTKDYVDHKQDYNSMAGRINSCEARIASLEKE